MNVGESSASRGESFLHRPETVRGALGFSEELFSSESWCGRLRGCAPETG